MGRVHPLPFRHCCCCCKYTAARKLLFSTGWVSGRIMQQGSATAVTADNTVKAVQCQLPVQPPLRHSPTGQQCQHETAPKGISSPSPTPNTCTTCGRERIVPLNSACTEVQPPLLLLLLLIPQVLAALLLLLLCRSQTVPSMRH
jgi:hypothetical protein